MHDPVGSLRSNDKPPLGGFVVFCVRKNGRL
jgi:hypothetical protein